jgi:uncharacterized protein YjeT (DUF2065 family)
MSARRKVGIAMPLLLTVLGLVSAAMAPVAARAATLLASSADQRIRLSSVPTRVAIAPATQTKGAQSLEATANHQVFLVLEGLSATLAPGASFDIFLGPAGAGPGRDDAGYAGTLNFYNISAATPADARAVSFDVTAVLARLRASGEIKNPLAVTIIPDAPPQQNSEPAIGRLRLIAP